MRFFNTAGPVVPARHYCLPPLSRIELDAVLLLIDQAKYFVLHAPRQTGKTSCLLALREHLNAGDRYRCVYVNVEIAQSARGKVKDAMRAILYACWMQAETVSADLAQVAIDPLLEQAGEHGALQALFSRWSQASDRPLVVLIDEIDALIGDTLISLLRQIRAGYAQRPDAFPQTVVLCGVRDVRDYRIHGAGQEIITGGSAFNIKAESLRLGNFSRDEVAALYQQHTADTGQGFLPEALDLAWELSRGQPWVVNALAYEAAFKLKQGRNRRQPIPAELIQQAKENLIERRETHLDQLTDKLREPRVRRVIGRLLSGEAPDETIPTDDLLYVRDLGLVTLRPQLAIANALYQEVIPRELTWSTQVTLAQDPAWYVDPDGRLNLAKLLTAFQQFFREHADAWLEQFQYREAGPQLLVQAFLQRIVNGGGRIDREYGLGRKRTDLLVQWPLDQTQGFLGPVQRAVLELKLLHRSLDATLKEGLAQTADYLDRTGAAEGHLLLFDRKPGVPWEQKLFQRTESYGSHRIRVWGM